MMTFYLPVALEDTNCPVIIDKDTIRVYEVAPTYNSTVNYTDYYVNSHYMSSTGSRTFSNYSSLPACESISYFTNNISYRNDFLTIFLTFLLIVGFAWFLISFIFKGFLTGGKKYV